MSKSIAAAKRVAAARIAVISAKCSSTKGRYRTELCGLPSICRWLRGPFSPLLFQKFHGIRRTLTKRDSPTVMAVARSVNGPQFPRRGTFGPISRGRWWVFDRRGGNHLDTGVIIGANALPSSGLRPMTHPSLASIPQ